MAFRAAEESRLLALPKSPDEYKLDLPKEWKAPEGVEFQLDANDPLFKQARDFAHRNKLSQDEFSAGIALLASSKVADAATIKTAREAEIAKLGTNGPARVTAITTWMDAKGYGALKPMLVTADMVSTFEKLMRDTQGGSSFSQQHRDTPANGTKIEGYDKMNFAQRRAAQDAAAAAKRPAN